MLLVRRLIADCAVKVSEHQLEHSYLACAEVVLLHRYPSVSDSVPVADDRDLRVPGQDPDFRNVLCFPDKVKVKVSRDFQSSRACQASKTCVRSQTRSPHYPDKEVQDFQGVQ